MKMPTCREGKRVVRREGNRGREERSEERKGEEDSLKRGKGEGRRGKRRTDRKGW